MKTKVIVRFPNESDFQEISIEDNAFIAETLFDDEVFGWYNKTYISIKRDDYDKLKKKIMKREDVYKILDGERDYQDRLSADAIRPDIIEDFHLGDNLTAMQYNLNKAIDAWYKEPTPYKDTMEFVRKIGALCVKAGENFGMPSRV